MIDNMECANQTGNSRRAITGAKPSHSVRKNGWLRTTSSAVAARVKSRPNLVRQMPPFCSGCVSTVSPAARYPRLVASNIGALSAQTIQCGTDAGNLIRDGLAVSRQIDKPSTPVRSGRQHALSCGSATKPSAAVAICTGMIRQTCRSIYTMLSHSPIRLYAPSLPIWCCSAKPAISSCIRGRT